MTELLAFPIADNKDAAYVCYPFTFTKKKVAYYFLYALIL